MGADAGVAVASESSERRRRGKKKKKLPAGVLWGSLLYDAYGNGAASNLNSLNLVCVLQLLKRPRRYHL